MLRIAAVMVLLIAAVNAGYLGAPLAYSTPIVTAPIVKTAVPIATSYQNTFKIAAAPVPLVVKPAPIVAAPIIKTAPIFAPALPIIKSPLVTYH
ncbi:uncharacterized protein LOC143203511 [Rhynchophorus ferrugineus]|uniref:uncharacterized protein LOC143203511 n=1 Tax=Rhynchophorus ferrugineus TaxID=354439 RepID=UPI003FCCBA36